VPYPLVMHWKHYRIKRVCLMNVRLLFLT
jgi:hypothetical protein